MNRVKEQSLISVIRLGTGLKLLREARLAQVQERHYDRTCDHEHNPRYARFGFREPAKQGRCGLDSHEGSEEEECDSDETQGLPLRGRLLRSRELRTEPPDQDESREHLKEAVEAVGKEGHAACHERGRQTHDHLEAVPPLANPHKGERLPSETIPGDGLDGRVCQAASDEGTPLKALVRGAATL